VTQDTKTLWASCQKYFSETIDATDYERLFSHVTFEAYRMATKTLVLQVPSQYIYEEIEKRYLSELRYGIRNTFGMIRLDWHVVMEQSGKKGGLIFESTDETLAPPTLIQPTERITGKNDTAAKGERQDIDSNLNPKQVFRTFLEGDSNRLSRSIGLRVAEHPNGTQFNPMFIFGPSGCGKTHLVNAIGNRCKEVYPGKRVLYVSARIFQQQFTTAMQRGIINDFIAFYQTIDMLIVDDIQEWMTATRTQDAFFHIFNHLYRNNRRILLVSDRAPVDMEGINKRLLTRFKSGIMAEMEQPNLQLCIDILKKKIAYDGLTVPADVVQYIAETANGSIRDLEGVINSLMAHSVVYNCSIDMNLVERVVKRAVKTDDMPLTVDDIIDRVCRHYEVTPAMVKGKSRKQEIVLARQLSMYLADKYTNIPATRIGKLVGNRDHSTVLHSISKIAEKLTKDKIFALEVEKVMKALKVKES
jgi:chromosomal replication initiator protein